MMKNIYKIKFDYFQNSSTTLLMAACLFATIYASLGMNTVYYRNGERCEVCAEEHVPYRQQTQTYYPSGGEQRVVYRTEERVITRPSTSSLSSYIADRGDPSSYPDSNFIHSIYFDLKQLFLISNIWYLLTHTPPLKKREMSTRFSWVQFSR